MFASGKDGKSALLAEDNPTAKILASDVSEERLRPMADLTRRLKLSNVLEHLKLLYM